MKSRAHIKSHPIHPILIPFPLAFFIGTFLFDILGWTMEKESFWQTGYYLQIAGVAFALLAAVPGIIDYIFTVPPNSSAKSRAAKHGLINVTVVVLFLATWFYRQRSGASPYIILTAEFIGVILLFISGWLGGTLVYRNQIGVDPRYAQAGKWKEEYINQADTPVQVATEDELQVNQMKLIHVKGKRIVIGRTETGYVAFDDRCPHKGGSLAGGSMMCGTVQCPWHGSQFLVENGAVTAGPAKEGIKTYNLTFQNKAVYLNVD
jgi:uncharacterized membrane protein/nitrite reductase/ring-hydroxylating ferredoxin subunit